MAGPYRFVGIDLRTWALLFAPFALLILFFTFGPPETTGAVTSWMLDVEGHITSRAPSESALERVFGLVLAVANGPGVAAAVLLDEGSFRLIGWRPLIAFGPVLLLFSLPVSWMFWTTAIVRFQTFIGNWDPFARVHLQSRRWLVMIWVKLAQWWEAMRYFGKISTGGLASLTEVLANRYLASDIFLGRPKLLIGGMMRPIGIPTEKHMVTIAGTGAGKSTGALIPNICVHEGSLLCIDPKGEIATITARRRGPGGYGVEGLQQRTYVVDPYGIVKNWEWGASSYNPFDEMARVAERSADFPVAYAGKIAQALVKSLNEKDAYWDSAAVTFLRGLILFIFVNEPPEQRNLVRLRELVSEGDLDSEEANVTAFTALLHRMKRAREGTYGDVISAAAGSVLKMAPAQQGSVLTTVQEHTAFLDAPEMKRVSLSSDFLLEDLKNDLVSVYLCLPLPAVTGKEGSWLRMFVLLLVDMMMRDQAKPDPPLLLAIDEFPSLGHLEGMDAVAPVLRSFGVRLWVVGQDIDQFKKAYPNDWAGFIGGAEAVQFMGIKHPGTVQMMVDMLGRHEVSNRRYDGKNYRWEYGERAVLDPEQASRLLSKGRRNQIIWRGDERALLLKICPYYEYLPVKYYDRDPRYTEKWNKRWQRWFASPGPTPPDDDDPPGPPPGGGRDALVPADLSKWAMPWPDPVEEEPDEASPAFVPPTPAGPGSALAELSALIGLHSVKAEVRALADLAHLQSERRRRGMPGLALAQHLVFTGNPGTGKTTVASLLGRIYKEMGVLSSGHVVFAERNTLVGKYIGHTAQQTKGVIARAMDGVLFIDEAYTLAPPDADKDFGAEAVAALLTEMEQHKDRLVVVVAGYPAEMERFVTSNPGLASRFKKTIHFPDYDSGDLLKIFEKKCGDNGCRLTDGARVRAAQVVRAIRASAGKGFGNGREMEQLFGQVIERQAARMRRGGSRFDPAVIEAEDIPGASPPPPPGPSFPDPDENRRLFSAGDPPQAPGGTSAEIDSLLARLKLDKPGTPKKPPARKGHKGGARDE
ncbi:MAG: hypothetical protein ABS36_08630 [Acidobacteria bacterium SCN 69-37]|nr:MAG: hypothetical protein ABS36_08630 [Acidobacteria bacterium SCN 69-37]